MAIDSVPWQLIRYPLNASHRSLLLYLPTAVLFLRKPSSDCAATLIERTSSVPVSLHSRRNQEKRGFCQLEGEPNLRALRCAAAHWHAPVRSRARPAIRGRAGGWPAARLVRRPARATPAVQRMRRVSQNLNLRRAMFEWHASEDSNPSSSKAQTGLLTMASTIVAVDHA